MKNFKEDTHAVVSIVTFDQLGNDSNKEIEFSERVKITIKTIITPGTRSISRTGNE